MILFNAIIADIYEITVDELLCGKKNNKIIVSEEEMESESELIKRKI